MKKTIFLAMASCAMLFGACTGNSKNGEAEVQEADPGPISEADKSRYNLNSTDEPLYGTTDTLKQDSLKKADSLENAGN